MKNTADITVKTVKSWHPHYSDDISHVEYRISDGRREWHAEAITRESDRRVSLHTLKRCHSETWTALRETSLQSKIGHQIRETIVAHECSIWECLALLGL